MPSEFLVGARYFQGNRSPNNAEREEKGYSAAWLHHKGRNKHHYEYWIDYSAKEIDGGMSPSPMPVRYVIEMFMDRIAASKVYLGDAYTDSAPLAYYRQGKEQVPMHEYTRKNLERLLVMLAESGEKKTFAYIKHRFLQN